VKTASSDSLGGLPDRPRHVISWTISVYSLARRPDRKADYMAALTELDKALAAVKRAEEHVRPLGIAACALRVVRERIVEFRGRSRTRIRPPGRTFVLG
jgi:hypothetical protein